MMNILEKIIKEKKETLEIIKKNNSLDFLEKKIRDINTFLNFNEITLNVLQIISQSFLMFGLFCIGSQFNSDQLTSISSKPLMLALLLWMAVIPSAYFLVKYF